MRVERIAVCKPEREAALGGTPVALLVAVKSGDGALGERK